MATERNNLGGAYQALGEFDRAIRYSNRRSRATSRPSGKTTLTWLDRNNLGLAYHAKGEFDRAIGYYEQALASDLKTVGEDHPQVATERNNLGGAYQALGEFDRAIGYYEHVADRNNLGGAYQALGEIDRAIRYYEQALAVFERRLGNEHPHTKLVRENLAAMGR